MVRVVGGGGTKVGGAGGGSLYIPIRREIFGAKTWVAWPRAPGFLLMEAQASSRLETADASRQKQIAFPFPTRQPLPHQAVWPPPAPLFGHQAPTPIGPFRQSAGRATTLTRRSAATICLLSASVRTLPPQGSPQHQRPLFHLSSPRACLSPLDGHQRLKTHVAHNTRPEGGFHRFSRLPGPHTRPGGLSKCSRHSSHAVPTLQGAAARGTTTP